MVGEFCAGRGCASVLVRLQHCSPLRTAGAHGASAAPGAVALGFWLTGSLRRGGGAHIQRSGRRAGVCARARPSRWNRTASSAECPRGSSWYDAGQSRILPPRGVRAFDAGGEAEPGLCAGVLVLRRRDALASPGVHPPGRVRAWCGQVCAAKCIGGGVASAYGGIMPLMSEFSTRRL